MINVLPAEVISAIRERRQRIKSDCQGERPFLVFRTKASDVVAALRREA